MSTNSTIAVKTNNGYKAIYCHWDGYPSYMYPMLRDWYGSEERARALVALGDASSINKRLLPSQDSMHSFDKPEEDVCVFYHRDRGEPWTQNEPEFYLTQDEVIKKQFYVYIFEDGCWHVYINGLEADDYSKFG
jgi:hypothetical protein